MEYSKEFVMNYVKRVIEENDLSNKEAAVLFGFNSPVTISQLKSGAWFPAQATFEKHFGPIDQVTVEEPVTANQIVEVKAEVIEAVQPKKKKGIVISADTLVELREMLDVLSYKFEYVAV